MSRPFQVHQVLATLGYGDAIGHEVLGIQRVLRVCGLRVGHLRRDGRPSPGGSDPGLPGTGRRQPSRQHPDSPLLHRVEGLAHRVRPARTGWCWSTTTSRRRNTSSTCTNCWCACVTTDGANSGAYVDRCDLALGDSEFNRLELEALGFPVTGVLPVVPDFSHLSTARQRPGGRSLRRRVDEHRLRRPGDPEQADREPDPVLRRLQDTVQSTVAAADRRLVRRIRALPHDAPRSGGTPERARHPLLRSRLERRTGRVLRRGGRVPLRQRTRRILRAADGGLPQADSRAGVGAHGGAGHAGRRRRAVRTRRSRRGGGPHRPRGQRRRAAGTDSGRPGRRAGPAARPRTSAARSCASSTRWPPRRAGRGRR